MVGDVTCHIWAHKPYDDNANECQMARLTNTDRENF